MCLLSVVPGPGMGPDIKPKKERMSLEIKGGLGQNGRQKEGLAEAAVD